MYNRIGIVLDNSCKCVEIILNIWNQGDSVAFADWRVPYKKIIESLAYCDVKECYVSEEIYNKWVSSEEDLKLEIKFIVVKDDMVKACFLPDEIYYLYHENYTDNEALVLFSSGTTGKSKGIILSHYAINTNADAVKEYMGLTSTDKISIVKSLSHSSTIVGELLVALKTRVQVLLSPTVTSPRATIKNIAQFGITVMCVNPTLLRIYTEFIDKFMTELQSLKVIYTSGSIPSEGLLQSARSAFRGVEILNVYGLTEAGPRVSAQVKGEKWQDGSVGRAIGNVEIHVVDENGNVLPCGERGIVHVNTKCLFKGYASGIPERKSFYNNWFNTGDIGYMNGSGELFIVGRWDNMILQGSHNVFPEDIESMIGRETSIEQCLVFSVKDEFFGERILCYYVATSDRTEELQDICLQKLASYEVPKEFIRVNEIPKTANGKVSRKLAVSIYKKEVI